ncbi:MAG: sugar ABC transporter ATP-binding protein [Clostridiaceae bacterium]|nr:sugar ABC transporter ATP-binding protein [Clostridiaceae bacterium]
MSEIILKAENIVKSFFGNRVLDHVQIELQPGKVHALCGENGAGKSTLLKIITGLYTKDSGTIYMDGKEITVNSVADAKKYGIYVVPQEMQIFWNLSVAENIFLNDIPMTRLGIMDWKRLYKNAEQIKAKLGQAAAKINVRAKAGSLSMGAWQMIEIMRAVAAENVRVLAFDEPTSSLSESEVEVLFDLIRQLRDRGIAIVYVSHKLKEIFAICDQVSVFRDGRYIGTRDIENTSSNELVSMMIGRNLNLFDGVKREKHIGEELLRAENYSHGNAYRNVSLQVRSGEILGLYGLVGAGRTELIRGIFGLDKIDSGKLFVKGKQVKIKNPQDAIRCGIGLVPEDRRGEGLMLNASLKWNLSMANLAAVVDKLGNIHKKKENAYVNRGMEIFSVKSTGPNQKASALSGGNQQKIVMAKWVLADCDVLIVDEPTRGVDVGAKAEMYQAMSDLTAQGKAVIMVSSELPEILGICDRIMVMCEGQVTAQLKNEDLTEEDVIRYAFSA